MIILDPSTSYPKRLIEVDLPIKRISDHARREKSIRHGHISTLHIWWARRPLGACRAVLCASLWPDPADPLCPPSFIATAREQMGSFWNTIDATTFNLDEPLEIRRALLGFIAEFANWDNSTDERYLTTARALTESAHVSLGGQPGTRPLVVDPFAGGGAIPLEALRVGADAFASDLNPVAVLLNKVVLEYIPKHGMELAEGVRKWGKWVKDEAEKELAEFYPKDPDGATPMAYLWARTVICENPSCGAEVPLLKSMWITRKSGRTVALKLILDQQTKRVDFEILENPNPKIIQEGTIGRGSATCPVCGYTTPVQSVRTQIKTRRGAASDARLFCVVTTRENERGRFYRLPTERDLEAVQKATEELKRRKRNWEGELSLVPDEPTPLGGGSGAGRAFSQRNYGMDIWADIFTSRQALSLVTLSGLLKKPFDNTKQESSPLDEAIQTCLSLVVDREANALTSISRWNAVGEKIEGIFSRQVIPIVWDYCEGNPFSDASGSLSGALNWVCEVVEFESGLSRLKSKGQSEVASATHNLLPDDSATTFFTDPPYYDAIPYSDLSDFFYVWLKRSLPSNTRKMFQGSTAPKDDECIVDEVKGKDNEYFETTMQDAMAEGRRILLPNGIGVVVFANKTTQGWEALLQAMINAGWVITGSWPIDTEMGSRLRSMNSAALASSVHIVCRPRENPDGSVRTEDVGDWGTVLKDLPPRIREWMARLSSENVVGADAIFACLGPALEIYSRYARVEKVSGEVVTLGEYLEHVWAAVSREALSTIFRDADTEGFEPDARLTAVWLWTLSAGNEETDDGNGEGMKSAGYALDYDTARKLSQGLGVHPEQMPSIVEVKGSVARLLSVRERTEYLFEKTTLAAPQKAKTKGRQLTLGGDSIDGTYAASSLNEPDSLDFVGTTTLDRVHYSMLLFASGKGDALGRFLKEDVGRDTKYAKLAQALSALYPAQSEEKRWVDGVLARKKSLGL